MAIYEINICQTVQSNHTIVFESEKRYKEVDLICEAMSESSNQLDDIKFHLDMNKFKRISVSEDDRHTTDLEIDDLREVKQGENEAS